MKIGYARVSAQGQKLDRQIAALRAAGVDEIYREKASGKSMKGRPQLDKAIDALGVGDVLFIAEWDRATRSMTDGLDIIARIAERQAAVKVLDRDYIDLTSTIGKGILAFLSALAQDERERIVKRVAGGRQAAVKRGVKFGPKPKLTDHQRAVALKRLAAGDSCKAIADDMGVSKATIWRVRA
jgi:DNA invertase Pin-like site-specific DNA recombinase